MSDDDALWQPRQQGNGTARTAHHVPRWQHIQTSSEQQDSQNTIRSLEARLARAQARQVAPVQVDGSDDDEDEDEDEEQAAEEDQEGLHLLWRDDLDAALQQRKVEEQYTWHWMLACIPRWCSCCFIT